MLVLLLWLIQGLLSVDQLFTGADDADDLIPSGGVGQSDASVLFVQVGTRLNEFYC